MKLHPVEKQEGEGGSGLQGLYAKVRSETDMLAAGLSDADTTVQSMEDASPAKWHMAHVSWFFEEIILKPHLPGYREFNERFSFLFNSYYDAVGARQPRPKRGMLTRPSLQLVTEYRQYVDDHMNRLFALVPASDVAALIELGLNHEQQHQELLLTDILHLFAQNPLKPAFRDPGPLAYEPGRALASGYTSFDGGVLQFGAGKGSGFSFDCESPRAEQLVQPFSLANGLVTGGDWIAFIADGGYENSLLWLSDGWAMCESLGWQAPLYWEQRGDTWWTMTLRGMQPVDVDAPVCHVSYYEADAYAAWAGKRLPNEFELELAARDQPVEGNFASSGRLRPAPVYAREDGGVAGIYGNVWQWTTSSFAPYRGYKPNEGVVGEYNGKFMSGQQVLRGGSCATPEGHIRPTYRNFWHPEKRWQFTGLRLAEDY